MSVFSLLSAAAWPGQSCWGLCVFRKPHFTGFVVCEWWELSSGPLEERYTLLTSPHPWVCLKPFANWKANPTKSAMFIVTVTLGRASLLSPALPGNLKQKVNFVGWEHILASCILRDLISCNPGRYSSEPPGDLIRFLSNPLKLATSESLKWCMWLLSKWRVGTLHRKAHTHLFEDISLLSSTSLCLYKNAFIKPRLDYANQLVVKFFLGIKS